MDFTIYPPNLLLYFISFDQEFNDEFRMMHKTYLSSIVSMHTPHRPA